VKSPVFHNEDTRTGAARKYDKVQQNADISVRTENETRKSHGFQVTGLEQRGSLANPDMERTEEKKAVV
jgi:hypothetical protein